MRVGFGDQVALASDEFEVKRDLRSDLKGNKSRIGYFVLQTIPNSQNNKTSSLLLLQ